MSQEDLPEIRKTVRAWTTRPPERLPQIARSRIVAQLADKRSWGGLGGWHGWKLAVTTAMWVAVLVLALLVPGPETPSGPSPVPLDASRGHSLVVHELRSGTKVYITLTPRTEPASKHATTGDRR